jgi:hypothetical protein
MAKSEKASGKIQVGDLFAVNIDPNLYAVLRIINIKDGWNLAEVLENTSTSATPSAQILDSEPLYPPVSFSLHDVDSGLLIPITGGTGLRTSYVQKLRYAMGLPGSFVLRRVNEARPQGKLSDGEAAKLPRIQFYAFTGMVKRIKEILHTKLTVTDWLKSMALESDHTDFAPKI